MQFKKTNSLDRKRADMLDNLVRLRRVHPEAYDAVIDHYGGGDWQSVSATDLDRVIACCENHIAARK